jgi:hypothetical protein
MKGRLRFALALATIAPWWLIAGANAQTPRTVRIEYEAPAGCPDERAFEGQVRGRSSRISVTAGGETVVRVRIAGRGKRASGEVTLADASGRESKRSVDGTCTDVVAALALIAALALDPTASTEREAPAPAASTAPAPSPPASSAPPPAASASTKPPAPAVSAPAAASSEQAAVTAATPHTWAWSIGAHAGVTGGVTPDVLFTVPVLLDVSLRAKGLFAPALRLRFERSGSGGTGPTADFSWTTGSLDLCPIAFSPGPLRFWPCVRAEAGALEAAGVGVSPTRTSVRPWVTLGLEVRVRLAIVGPIFAEIEGGAFAPLVRDRFFLEPAATIHTTPAVAPAGAAGIGVTFW